MRDIVEAARASLEWDEGHHTVVEELIEEIERLRAALKWIAGLDPNEHELFEAQSHAEEAIERRRADSDFPQGKWR